MPLVVIFTKFDGQIIQESTQLNEAEDKWDKARENADKTFQGVYLPKVLSTQHPPKAYVRLEGENLIAYVNIISPKVAQQIWTFQEMTVQN